MKKALAVLALLACIALPSFAAVTDTMFNIGLQNSSSVMTIDPESKGEYGPELRSGLGISSLAATCIELLGYEAPEGYDPSVLEFK